MSEVRDALTGARGLIDTTIFQFADPPFYTIMWSILYSTTPILLNNQEVYKHPLGFVVGSTVQ